MNAISKKWTGTDPPKTNPNTVRFVFWGAVTGLFAGLATLLAASTSYGAMTGLDPVNCAVFGATITVLLSQPAGLAGLLVGAACGGICAFVARYVHHQ